MALTKLERTLFYTCVSADAMHPDLLIIAHISPCLGSLISGLEVCGGGSASDCWEKPQKTCLALSPAEKNFTWAVQMLLVLIPFLSEERLTSGELPGCVEEAVMW